MDRDCEIQKEIQREEETDTEREKERGAETKWCRDRHRQTGSERWTHTVQFYSGTGANMLCDGEVTSLF